MTFNNFNESIHIKDNLNALEDNLTNEFNIKLDLAFNSMYNTIILSRIIVDKNKRNMGIGTKVLQSICDFADLYNLRIALTPTTDFGGSKNRLIDFYKQFGFINYKGYEFKESMVRLPAEK